LVQIISYAGRFPAVIEDAVRDPETRETLR